MNEIVIDEDPWLAVEREMACEGAYLPLSYRWAWAKGVRGEKPFLLTVRDLQGKPIGAAAVQVERSRTLPGHRYLRLQRFGHGIPRRSWEDILGGLKSLARHEPGVLQASVSVFSRDHREEMTRLLARHKFEKTKQRSYRHTLTIDLQAAEEQIQAGFHSTARKNLRQAERAGAVAVPLTEDKYAEVLRDLQNQSMQRSGGKFAAFDAGTVLQLSREHPELSRIVGLFPSEERTRPEDLMGFTWGCMHGDHAEYRAAGTRRIPDNHVPISYPLLWDLVRWAKREGGTWFDLGGVTLGETSADPLYGISQFKRMFSRTVEEVGEEWVYVPNPARLRLANALGVKTRAISDWVSRMNYARTNRVAG